MNLILIRHGQTDWNREGRFQGRMDVPLNETGTLEAAALASRLKDVSVDWIVSSPLSRAMKTAEAITQFNMDMPDVEVCADLVEISHGDWEGLLFEEVLDKWPDLLRLWRNRPSEVTMPNGENLHQVAQRAIKAIKAIRERVSNGQTVCVVTHDAVIKAILCDILQAPLDSFWRFIIPNASLTVIKFIENIPKLALLGDSNHLNKGFIFSEQKGL
ncbi:MAG: histidine phosphatase family protein [Thermanaerothrix sp.]|nr:histidine phosphatase family protein [Thermanaerothrix sp.]